MLIYRNRERARDYVPYSGGGGGGGNPLTSVYGSNLFNYWSNLNSGTGVYTDSVNSNNIGFGTTNVPSTTTTSHGQQILNIVLADVGTSSSTPAPPGGTAAMQIGCIFNITNGTVVGTPPECDFSIIANGGTYLYIGAGWGDAVGDNQYIFTWTSAANPSELIQKNNVGTGYHTCVVDVRSSGQLRLYVDGAFFGSITPAVPIDVTTLQNHRIDYRGDDTQSEGIGAAFVAYKSSDFTLDTDAIAACNALATLFP